MGHKHTSKRTFFLYLAVTGKWKIPPVLKFTKPDAKNHWRVMQKFYWLTPPLWDSPVAYFKLWVYFYFTHFYELWKSRGLHGFKGGLLCKDRPHRRMEVPIPHPHRRRPQARLDFYSFTIFIRTNVPYLPKCHFCRSCYFKLIFLSEVDRL